MKREPSTKSEEKTAEVDGQNRLYEILERELQAKNERIAALQAELSKERQHSRERLTQAKEQAAEKAEHRTIDRKKVRPRLSARPF